MFTSFFTSHYLNRITDSRQRATVLGFKGLAFNLAYGLIGVAFALLIARLRDSELQLNPGMSEPLLEAETFMSATFWFLPYTGAILAVCCLLAGFLLRNTTVHREKG